MMHDVSRLQLQTVARQNEVSQLGVGRLGAFFVVIVVDTQDTEQPEPLYMSYSLSNQTFLYVWKFLHSNLAPRGSISSRVKLQPVLIHLPEIFQQS